MKQSVRFKHGCVQIGYVDDIIHGVGKWVNINQCIINFCMEKKILNHFLQYGDKYYSRFVDAGYSRGLFIQR